PRSSTSPRSTRASSVTPAPWVWPWRSSRSCWRRSSCASPAASGSSSEEVVMAVTSPTPTTPGGPQPGPPTRRPLSKPAGLSRTGDVAFSGFSHLFLAVWAIMVVYPMLWVVMSSFKDDAQIIKDPLSLIPNGLHWDNFYRAWFKGHIGDFFLN